MSKTKVTRASPPTNNAVAAYGYLWVLLAHKHVNDKGNAHGGGPVANPYVSVGAPPCGKNSCDAIREWDNVHGHAGKLVKLQPFLAHNRTTLTPLVDSQGKARWNVTFGLLR